MGRKYEVTGQAVIYTAEGAKIIDCEVRRWANVHGDWNEFHFDNKFRKEYGEKYILIGGARTVPTDDIFAQPAYHPETIDRAYRYTQSKFFRLMLDLMRLAQWEPINKANVPLEKTLYIYNGVKALPVDDASLFERYGFTQPMIDFAEARYK